MPNINGSVDIGHSFTFSTKNISQAKPISHTVRCISQICAAKFISLALRMSLCAMPKGGHFCYICGLWGSIQSRSMYTVITHSQISKTNHILSCFVLLIATKPELIWIFLTQIAKQFCQIRFKERQISVFGPIPINCKFLFFTDPT